MSEIVSALRKAVACVTKEQWPQAGSSHKLCESLMFEVVRKRFSEGSSELMKIKIKKSLRSHD